MDTQNEKGAEHGHVSARGTSGVFVGHAVMDGKKAILVLSADGRVTDTCFFTADETYFPMRPKAQRRFLPTGVFGDQGENVSLFDHNRFPAYDPNALIEGECEIKTGDGDVETGDGDELSDGSSGSGSRRNSKDLSKEDLEDLSGLRLLPFDNIEVFFVALNMFF